MTGVGPSSSRDQFDAYADDYDAQLHAGLSLTGEDNEYYARGRVRWLAARLARLAFRPRTVLDYGCGTGSSTPFLLETIGAEHLLGVDVSAESIRIARSRFAVGTATFAVVRDVAPSGSMDLAFCNGVFHHIAPAERSTAAGYVFRSLHPGGIFAFWENNPWNPGTRYVMKRIAFDADANTLTAGASRALLRAAGFQVLHTDFLFIFPAALRLLRWIEPMVAALPLGGQYLVLCRKPT
jgi:trans-aconitate methyltransferase